MTSPARKRVLLYAGAALLAAGLCFVGWGLEIAPDAGTRLGGAAVMFELGQVDEAIAICRRTIQEHPDCLDAYVYLATFLGGSGNYGGAVTAYDQALARVPAGELQRNLMLDRASVLLKAGRRAEFDRARERLARGGSDYRVHVADAMVQAESRNWAAAVTLYRQALQSKPEDHALRSRIFQAEMERGRQAVAQGRFEDAAGAFDAARELFPVESRAHLEAASARLRQGRPLEAVEVLREVRPDTPGAPALVFDAATAFLDSERDTLAFWALRAAVQGDPEQTRDLLRTDPAWTARQRDPRVLEILALTTDPAVRLTGSE